MKNKMIIACLLGLYALVPTVSVADDAKWVDHAKIAKERRVVNTATDSYTALYDLSFADLETQINRNIRLFSLPGAYVSYVDDLKSSGLKADVQKDMLVVQNRIVTDPKIVSASSDDYAVSFDVERKMISHDAVTTKCLSVEVFLVKNDVFDLRSAEYSMVGLPRVDKSSSCN